MEKKQLGPCITFFPQPLTLIGTRGADGRADLMAASWVGIVSKTPPTMGVSLHEGRQTYRQVRETGVFTVNMVPASLTTEADFCGLASGRDLDKAAVTGLTLLPGTKVPAPLVAESPLNVECRLTGEVALGDYRLLLGEILEIHVAAAAVKEGGGLQASAFDPAVYLGGIREYWSLGRQVGTAYKDGKKYQE